MAVMPMKRISIYALKNRRKQILELIQRRGVVEIDDRKADETVFAKMDTVPAKSRFENNAAALQSALDALDKLEPPEKSLFASLNGRDAIPLSKYQETADGAGELLKIASRINTLWKKCADNRGNSPLADTNPCAGTVDEAGYFHAHHQHADNLRVHGVVPGRIHGRNAAGENRRRRAGRGRCGRRDFERFPAADMRVFDVPHLAGIKA